MCEDVLTILNNITRGGNCSLPQRNSFVMETLKG